MKIARYIILSGLAVLTAFPLQAKEKKEKRPAEEYLPKAGDFAVSISANPLTRYLGNLFNGTSANHFTQVGGQPYLSGSENWNILQPLISVSGKYMVTDHFATRINIGWMYDHDKNNFYATDDAALLANPFSQKQVIDTYIYNNAGGSFSLAGEYRIGNRRVQGIVGGGLLYAFSTQKEKFSYGNAITEINQNPSTGIDPALSTAPAQPGFASQRYLSRYTGAPTHYFGLVAFIGVEWFFAPWVSLGGEVNVAAAWNWTKARYYEAEGFSSVSGTRESWTQLESPRSSGFDFGTGNIGANISITFYFNRNK